MGHGRTWPRNGTEIHGRWSGGRWGEVAALSAPSYDGLLVRRFAALYDGLLVGRFAAAVAGCRATRSVRHGSTDFQSVDSLRSSRAAVRPVRCATVRRTRSPSYGGYLWATNLSSVDSLRSHRSQRPIPTRPKKVGGHWPSSHPPHHSTGYPSPRRPQPSVLEISEDQCQLVFPSLFSPTRTPGSARSTLLGDP
jgi:hypothetical protein